MNEPLPAQERCLEVRNPVGEIRGEKVRAVPRLGHLAGKKIGLFHNHKPNATVCLEYLREQLQQRAPDLQFYVCGRGHSSGGLSDEVVEGIRQAKVDGLVAAYGD